MFEGLTLNKRYRSNPEFWAKHRKAQSAGDTEYTDCISAEEGDFPTNECPGYDTKQSYGEPLVMQELWRMWSISWLPVDMPLKKTQTLDCHYSQVHFDAEW